MLNEAEKDLVTRLKNYGETHVVTLDRILKMKDGHEAPVGDDENHVINVAGARIVYSIEDQPEGKVRHLSFTLQLTSPILDLNPNKRIMTIAEWFGFKFGDDVGGRRSTMWVEPNTKFGDAVNLLQEVEEPHGD